MKNQTRDLKKCIYNRFVENFKGCVIGAVGLIIFAYALWTFLCSVSEEHRLLAALSLYYFVIAGALTTVIIINRKLKRGFVNFIKRFLIMAVVILPLFLITASIHAICIIGFPLMVGFASGIVYIILCSDFGSVIVMLFVMCISSIIALAFALAMDDCLKMTKWLNGVANSIKDLIILEDDDSL